MSDYIIDIFYIQYPLVHTKYDEDCNMRTYILVFIRLNLKF